MVILLYLVFGQKKESFSSSQKYGGISWPQGSYYRFDREGDIIIEIAQSLKVLGGKWPSGSTFFFDGNNLIKILPSSSFLFADFEFKSVMEITQEEFQPNLLHSMKLTYPVVIDGLDLKPNCMISFKNLVLYSATCDDFGTVYFKRFVELPEVPN
ncbi:MAG: hypothetical protein HON90_17460 [Halobacteriovoraceae bacterium]|nr:hypothetical protein [Halobacteriovoraceae bacterium]